MIDELKDIDKMKIVEFTGSIETFEMNIDKFKRG